MTAMFLIFSRSSSEASTRDLEFGSPENVFVEAMRTELLHRQDLIEIFSRAKYAGATIDGVMIQNRYF
jgi:hypothetical protein